jgi:hypothetical protein
MKMLSGAIVVLAGAVVFGAAAMRSASSNVGNEASGLGGFLVMGGLALLVWGIIDDSSARRASTQGQAARPPVQPPLPPGV